VSSSVQRGRLRARWSRILWTQVQSGRIFCQHPGTGRWVSRLSGYPKIQPLEAISLLAQAKLKSLVRAELLCYLVVGQLVACLCPRFRHPFRQRTKDGRTGCRLTALRPSQSKSASQWPRLADCEVWQQGSFLSRSRLPHRQSRVIADAFGSSVMRNFRPDCRATPLDLHRLDEAL
jgi:hypothetical protein